MKKHIWAVLSASILACGMIISTASASTVNVLVLDESRVGTISNSNGSINFNFKTGDGFSEVRSDLLSSFNVSFLESVSELSASALNSANVVILSYSTALSASEKSNLGAFINQGGGLIAFANNAATD